VSNEEQPDRLVHTFMEHDQSSTFWSSAMARSNAVVVAIGIVILPLCGCPGFPRPEDGLEPNDTKETATMLEVGVPVEARAVQGDPDVFRVSAGPARLLILTLESLGEEDCAAFTVTGPDGTELFADQHHFCGDRGYEPPVAVAGADLNTETEGRHVLSVPAEVGGDYFLTINELGEVDNFFDFSWLYRLTATTTEPVE